MARRPGQDGTSSRQAILAGAEEVFAAKGYSGASLSEIAAAAGVNKSLIHHHFGSKGGLWKTLKDDRFARFAAVQQEIMATPSDAPTFVRQSFLAYFNFLRDHPMFRRILLWSEAEGGSSEAPTTEADDPARQQMRALGSLGVARMEMFQRQGSVRADIDPRFLLAAYLGLLRHWFVARQEHRLLRAGETDRELDQAYLDSVTTLFLDAVLTGGGAGELENR